MENTNSWDNDNAITTYHSKKYNGMIKDAIYVHNVQEYNFQFYLSQCTDDSSMAIVMIVKFPPPSVLQFL